MELVLYLTCACRSLYVHTLHKHSLHTGVRIQILTIDHIYLDWHILGPTLRMSVAYRTGQTTFQTSQECRNITRNNYRQDASAVPASRSHGVVEQSVT